MTDLEPEELSVDRVSRTALLIIQSCCLGQKLASAFALKRVHVGLMISDLRGPINVDKDTLLKIYNTDLTDVSRIGELFCRFEADFGPPDIVVFGEGLCDESKRNSLMLCAVSRNSQLVPHYGSVVGECTARAMIPRGYGLLAYVNSAMELSNNASASHPANDDYPLSRRARILAQKLSLTGVQVKHFCLRHDLSTWRCLSRTVKLTTTDAVDDAVQSLADDILSSLQSEASSCL